MQGPTQPFNPWPDLVSDWGLEEVRRVPHVSPLVAVRWETMGFIRGMVSQLFATGCRFEAESSVPYNMPLFNPYI